MTIEEKLAAMASDTAQKVKGSYVDAILLRDADDTVINLRAIADAGFTGCVRHYDLKKDTIWNQKLVVNGYSYVKSNQTDIESRLNEVIQQKGSLLFVFDLTSKPLTTHGMEKMAKVVFSCIEEKELEYRSMTETIFATRNHAMTQEELDAGFKLFEEEQEAILKELRSEREQVWRQ